MATTTTPAGNPNSGTQKKLLLAAQFSDLVAINFQVDDHILKPLVPPGLELDYFDGETFVSLIALTLKNLKIWGLPFSIIPACPEISLRFYVRRKHGEDFEKGTCLIKDYVGGATAAWYLEKQFGSEFLKLKMSSKTSGFAAKQIPEAEYQWKRDEQWNKLRVKARSRITNAGAGTKVGFVLNHQNYFGVVKGRTMAFPVERPAWEVWDAAQANFNCDVKRLFGREFVKPLSKRPASVFVTPGSQIKIFRPIEVR